VTAFGAKTIQDYSPFTDTISSSNGGDGYGYCGLRTHYITLPGGE